MEETRLKRLERTLAVVLALWLLTIGVLLSKSVHSGIGHFRIRVPILKQFKGLLKVPVEGLRTILMEQER
jgi:hypothetical protein